MDVDSIDDSNDSDYDVNGVSEGFHGCGVDVTMVHQDVMMPVTIIVVLLSWMPNVINMMMIVVMLTVRDNVMIVSKKGTTQFTIQIKTMLKYV